MPTNEERREVARKLRELTGTFITIGDLESALCIDMSSGRVDIARDAESISSLADLIEPDPERTCRNVFGEDKFVTHPESMFKCSECGCHVTDCESYAINIEGKWNYCPNCGLKVVE